MATAHLLSKPLSDEEASRWVDKGLPWGEADFLAKELEIDLAKLASLSGISESTFFRRKAQKRFTPAESDHVMRFARLWNLAVRVIADEEGAREWLKSNEIGLKGRIPLEVAATEAGGREVETLLKRIEFGILA
jgi:putative toxin-antitoxin system antitoxin component (TIGR02293 family)